LCVPTYAKDFGSVKVIHTNEDGSKTDITNENHEVSDSSSKPHASDEEETESENNDTKEKSEEDSKGGLWEDSIKAFRTAVSGGLEDFSYLIINQLMAGSVTIFETDTKTVEGDNGPTSLITYSVKNKEIKPFDPSFVRTAVMYTGGFYLIIAGLVILGSYIMLMLYQHKNTPFVDFMASVTGEERPYDTNMQTTACVGAGVTWIIFIIAAILISEFRNLVVYAISPKEVTLPEMYADSIPTQLLSSLGSFNNAMQSTLGEYGIHVFAALILVTASASIFLLMLGAVREFGYFLVFAWGVYTLSNFIDIINVGTLSAGVQLYLYTGNPNHITIGLILGGGINLFIIYLLIRYAASRIGYELSEV
jgi:hypothetical protein